MNDCPSHGYCSIEYLSMKDHRESGGNIKNLDTKILQAIHKFVQLCFILLTHEVSHREVYQEFQSSGAKGCSDHRFREPPAYTSQLLNQIPLPDMTWSVKDINKFIQHPLIHSLMTYGDIGEADGG